MVERPEAPAFSNLTRLNPHKIHSSSIGQTSLGHLLLPIDRICLLMVPEIHSGANLITRNAARAPLFELPNPMTTLSFSCSCARSSFRTYISSSGWRMAIHKCTNTYTGGRQPIMKFSVFRIEITRPDPVRNVHLQWIVLWKTGTVLVGILDDGEFLTRSSIHSYDWHTKKSK